MRANIYQRTFGVGDEVPLSVQGILNKFLHFFRKLLV